MYICKGKCDELGTTLKGSDKQVYDSGRKYCVLCATWFLIEGNRCPCCGSMLRTKRRVSKEKALQHKRNYD